MKVEYLVFIENQSIKCTDNKTFNHLLQSDPDITITKNKLTHKKLTVDFSLKSGVVKNTDKNYFHLTLTSSVEKIDDFAQLLRAIKSVLHITNKTPQTLYDGVSLHYAHLAYPLVFEIENLMRKLITKFMLTNVGIDWMKDRVPDDVKNSINSENRDLTYLHNVDFIQLKNFLFSENYPTHKETLIQKLKKAKNIQDLNLDDIKALIPNSNWEKFFSDTVEISKEQLSKQWDDLYDLRCKIAHNRAFSKTDFDEVEKLSTSLKEVLLKAISKLEQIEISESEREVLTETIAGNFNYLFGDFMSAWRELTRNTYKLVDAKILSVKPDALEPSERRIFLRDLTLLFRMGIIDKHIFSDIRKLINIRNEIVHNTETITREEAVYAIEKTKEYAKLFAGWL